jgi:hypothetical protein
MKNGTDSKLKTVGDEEGFIALLRTACDDRAINSTLERLLSLPDSWVSELLVNGAPQEFVRAIACLLDDRVAEKAYEVIFQCSRKSFLPRKIKRQ